MSHSPPQVDWLIQFSVGCQWVYSLFGLSTWRTVFRLENSLFFPEKWSKLRITQKFIVLRIVTYQTYAREVGVRFVFSQVKSNMDFSIFFFRFGIIRLSGVWPKVIQTFDIFVFLCDIFLWSFLSVSQFSKFISSHSFWLELLFIVLRL